MLITSRGREILQNTVDLAIENGLDVSVNLYVSRYISTIVLSNENIYYMIK
jgi:hypothetical protein